MLSTERCVACRRDSPRVTEAEVVELKPQIPDWQPVERDGIARLERAWRLCHGNGGHEWGDRRRRAVMSTILLVLLAMALAAGGGCVTPRQVTLTPRSGVEQELIVRSLERAVARLDVERFVGRRVVLDLFSLTPDQSFAREFVTARLQRRGVEVIGDWARADIRLKVFATVLGIDRGQTLIGIPALQAPVVSIPIPEIAIFKWERHRGLAEIQVYAYDPKTDQLLDGVPAARGRAKFDEFRILLVIGFAVSDLDVQAEPPEPTTPP